MKANLIDLSDLVYLIHPAMLHSKLLTGSGSDIINVIN